MNGFYCPHCGSPLQTTKERCTVCGATLREAPSMALNADSGERVPSSSELATPTLVEISAPSASPIATHTEHQSEIAPETPASVPQMPTTATINETREEAKTRTSVPYQAYPAQQTGSPTSPPQAAGTEPQVRDPYHAQFQTNQYPYQFPNPYAYWAWPPLPNPNPPMPYGGYPSPQPSQRNWPSQNVQAASTVAPGYPAYPQGPQGAKMPYPEQAIRASAATYGYGMGGYGTPGYYFYPVYISSRRAPGETYALVVSWITTSLGGLAILGGIALALLFLLASGSGQSNSLSFLGSASAFTLAPLIGGSFALYFGIRGILRRTSPRFTMPNPWLFVGLAALVFLVGVILWNINASPGPALAVTPLLILSGVLPALAILAFTAWRLHFPSTKRHVWMSLIYGLTGATLLALIFEFLLELIAALAIVAFGGKLGSATANPTNANPTNPVEVIFLLILVSVIAPIVEEGVKPLGAVLIMRRIKTPASAFLTGLAAGVGFDMFETIGVYIGTGQADWITVAIERLGAGLLHGVGAGMGALGWYYLINGKGVRLRWVRGFGAMVYALLQHAIFNGSSVITILPGPFEQWTQKTFFIDKLPIDYGSTLFFIYYAIILGVLIFMTGRLAHSKHRHGQQPPTPASTHTLSANTTRAPGVASVGSSVQ